MGSVLKSLTYISKFNSRNEIHEANVRNVEKKLMIPGPLDNVDLILNLNKDINLNLNDTKEDSLNQLQSELNEELELKDSQSIRDRILNIEISNIDLDLSKHNLSTDIENLQETKIQPVDNSIEKSDHGNFLDIFEKTNFLNLIGSILLMAVLGLASGVTMQINQKMGIKNPYLDGALLGAFETIGYILVFIFCNRIGRRTINVISTGGTLICSLLIITLDLVYNLSSSDLLNKPMILNISQLGWFYIFLISIHCFLL